MKNGNPVYLTIQPFNLDLPITPIVNGPLSPSLVNRLHELGKGDRYSGKRSEISFEIGNNVVPGGKVRCNAFIATTFTGIKHSGNLAVIQLKREFYIVDLDQLKQLMNEEIRRWSHGWPVALYNRLSHWGGDNLNSFIAEASFHELSVRRGVFNRTEPDIFQIGEITRIPKDQFPILTTSPKDVRAFLYHKPSRSGFLMDARQANTFNWNIIEGNYTESDIEHILETGEDPLEPIIPVSGKKEGGWIPRPVAPSIDLRSGLPPSRSPETDIKFEARTSNEKFRIPGHDVIFKVGEDSLRTIALVVKNGEGVCQFEMSGGLINPTTRLHQDESVDINYHHLAIDRYARVFRNGLFGVSGWPFEYERSRGARNISLELEEEDVILESMGSCVRSIVTHRSTRRTEEPRFFNFSAPILVDGRLTSVAEVSAGGYTFIVSESLTIVDVKGKAS